MRVRISSSAMLRWLAPFLIAVGLGGAGIYVFVLQPLPGIPAFETVRAAYVESEGILLDRNGEIIHELRISREGRRLEWTPLSRISPALQSAVIAGEDRRFHSHRGVDWMAAGVAFLQRLRGSGGRGASTITMQLSALVNEELRPERSRRSLLQKSTQMRAARGYERSWSKEQILEAYLNLATFRGELQGVAAAARGLFDKAPHGLNDIESALLAALLRSPNADVERVSERAYALACRLAPHTRQDEVSNLAAAVMLGPYRVRPQARLAPHVARQLLDRQGSVSCTLDGELQSFAAESLRRHVLSNGSRNVHDGALLVVDSHSGEVLAYVGNIGRESSARYVDGIRAPRQAGSTLKPFIYALAFGDRILTPASLIDDSPLDVPAPGGVYRPRNYDNIFHGLVTARTALASSLNVPAVKTLKLVGVDSAVELLRRLGFDNLRDPEFYGPALALGSADVTLWDLVNAYRTIAGGGAWTPLRITMREPKTPAVPVLSRETAFLIADILSDRESRSRTFDLESPLATRFWSAVKTGTSKDMRDNWCIGFSDRFTVGVWTGNFSGEPMRNVSGITGAAPVWVEIMNWLHQRQTSRPPKAPPGLVRLKVGIPALALSTSEWFLHGTEAPVFETGAERTDFPEITYPTEGMVVALDPDIPGEQQRLFFEMSSTTGEFEWLLDGHRLGPARGLIPWKPQRGAHVLVLAARSGKAVDEVAFEVR